MTITDIPALCTDCKLTLVELVEFDGRPLAWVVDDGYAAPAVTINARLNRRGYHATMTMTDTTRPGEIGLMIRRYDDAKAND